MKKILLILLIIILGCIPPVLVLYFTFRSVDNNDVKKNINILFIGNSKTYYNNFPLMFVNMVNSSDSYKVNDYRVLISPGASLGEFNSYLRENEDLFLDIVGNKKIKYDYVVLQPQIKEAMEGFDQSSYDLSEFLVKNNNKDIKIIINSIWYKEENNIDNFRFDSGKIELNSFRACSNINRKLTKCSISKSGNCFYGLLNNTNNKIDLFAEDRLHPSKVGSYLMAYELYKKIYGDVDKINYYGDITREQALESKKKWIVDKGYLYNVDAIDFGVNYNNDSSKKISVFEKNTIDKIVKKYG